MSIHLNREQFIQKVFDYEKNKEWKYQGDLPAVIDFWAPWCGPCRMVGPILDELSKEYEGKIHVYKVNVDDEQEVAGVFGIRSIPSMLFVPAAGEPKMAVGALPRDALKQAIEDELLKVQAAS
ncbi:MAG: thioredoxin [Ignavibacteria bacterium GWA2_55_11]|nr:MAG: thioredoxin [Ignavibacteria bacterium GWA2_55_11]OGU47212.1 MAG: thioredoxin [Ignavibacteria bacterium GWC2_56_12]OGU66507.1 MAG: thioredoxin [Ignavibacteria bacterium RIFCSPHIGHO2_02_FULL_56_12]OGU73561.1 MAG: thioredoxin [Ignavibacteria bacterium RIFCSPLOWO2_12_FULL_56_21]OGU74135.1 MAG: thioredoxin [Ignavibacteria bacterium RIFCSPLOWO2_02_FULL_55_14]HAV22994.1 thioredoxin [Bacteroidota bacterium]